MAVLSAGVWASIVVPLVAVEKPISKPNLLFIMVDDLGKDWISCYGAEDIATPNIDALANGGMKFHNAYSMPSCTPSRATLLTGKYPWRNGWASHWDVPRWGVAYFDWKKKENTTFARLMKELGYVTCAAGKWQINDFRIEPQAMKKHGFDDWAMWTGYETGYAASAERHYDAYINTPTDGSRTYSGNFGPDIFTDHLINFMRQHKDEPMCLYYPMVLAHPPQVSTPDEPEVTIHLDKHKAMVRYIDKLVGRLVDTLDELGIRERTIVIFTTDNGTVPGVTGTLNGLRVKGAKGTAEELDVCGPFIVNGPGMVPEGVETEALTDLSDMLPTFVELGGGDIPEDLVIDGTSIAPLILGKEQDTKRKWIMAQGYGTARLTENGVRGETDFEKRVIRDKRYKVWVSREKRVVRLHDLKKDPWEETNLLDSDLAAHKEALQKFQAVIDSLPDKDAHRLYEPRASNPWDMKLSDK